MGDSKSLKKVEKILISLDKKYIFVILKTVF